MEAADGAACLEDCLAACSLRVLRAAAAALHFRF